MSSKQVIKKFPLVFSLRYAGNFIRGENISNIKELYKECRKYNEVCKTFNRGLLQYDKPLDLSFCKLPPKPNQELPIKILLAFHRAFLFGSVGVGKTYISGYVIIKRLRDGKAKKALIVTPKVAVKQFQDELIKFFDFPVSWFGDKILITNYEGLYYHQEGEISELIKPEYKDVDFVILDEVHLVKNPYSVRAAAVAEICKNAKYRIAMTGTPIRNQPNDLFFPLSIINPWAFKMSYHHFLRKYFIQIKGKNYVKYEPRPQRLNEIAEIVEANTIKVEKEKEELKGISYQTIAVEPTTKQLNLATEIATEIIEKEGTLLEVKNTIMKLQQVSSGFLIYRGNFIERFESPKIERAIETVSEYVKSGEQVIIFAKFHETIGRIFDALVKRRIKAETLTGKATDKVANQVVERFRAGKIDVLIIQIRKGELALNLQNARRVVFVEYDWTPASIEQAVARVYRTGQKREVFVDFFITKGLMDDRILKTAKSKGKVSSRVLKREIARFLTKTKH